MYTETMIISPFELKLYMSEFHKKRLLIKIKGMKYIDVWDASERRDRKPEAVVSVGNTQGREEARCLLLTDGEISVEFSTNCVSSGEVSWELTAGNDSHWLREVRLRFELF